MDLHNYKCKYLPTNHFQKVFTLCEQSKDDIDSIYQREYKNKDEIIQDFSDLTKSCQIFFQIKQLRIVTKNMLRISHLLLYRYKQFFEIIDNNHFLEFVHGIFLQNIESLNEGILYFIVSYTCVINLPDSTLFSTDFFAVLNHHIASGSHLALNAYGNIIPIISKSQNQNLLLIIELDNIIKQLHSSDIHIVEVSLFCINNLIIYNLIKDINKLIPIFKSVLYRPDVNMMPPDGSDCGISSIFL